ncbi:hypothetical protein T1E_0317 [Pseudomonas putida DOT-T1E]|uniref:Uncharacterized protein n=1 Tax=Pseudomonas putida (strain DOT-T1E) TaxID=1196325 RepID=I7BZB9_PSEPT|nr:hypothetical protein T1E_0317 [Pseudomonas putida DOT-T1E]
MNAGNVVVMARCYGLLEESKQTWMSLPSCSRMSEYPYERAAFRCEDNSPNCSHR